MLGFEWVTKFPHYTCIGSCILSVLPQHIPSFFTPAFYTYSVPHSCIPPLPHFTNIPCQMSLHQRHRYCHLEASWPPCRRHYIHSARPLHRCDIRWRLAIIIQIKNPLHTSCNLHTVCHVLSNIGCGYLANCKPRTGEPVKCELFANSVGDWLWRQWSRDTWFAEYQWPSCRRDLVNSEPQMANSLHQSHMSVNSKSMWACV